jgi:cell division protein FtsW (lipid II flippase)
MEVSDMKPAMLAAPALIVFFSLIYLQAGPDIAVALVIASSLLSFRLLPRLWAWRLICAAFLLSMLAASILLFAESPIYNRSGVLSFAFLAAAAAGSYLEWAATGSGAQGDAKPPASRTSTGRRKNPGAGRGGG